MARARNIKPGFFTNDVLADCDPLARLLFAGLWTVADRAGRLEDRPKRIKAAVLPYDSCDVDTLLNQLHNHGFIERYEVDGLKLIQVLAFDKHQNPHKNESDSELPSPEQHSTCTVQAPEQHSTNPADSLNPITDSLSTDSLHTAPDGSEAADAAADEPVAEKSKPAKPARQAYQPPEWVPNEQWADFVQMRKAMRSVPFTDAAARGVVSDLNNLRGQGFNPAELLTAAVTNGWRTVYPPKGAGRPPSRASPPQSKHAAAARAIYGAPSNPEFIDVETVVRQH